MDVHFLRTALALASVCLGVFSFAQSPPPGPRVVSPHGRMTVAGTEFTVEGAGNKTRVDDVNHGRRFRGDAFAKVILRASLRLPEPNAKLEGLAVHFKTSKDGPSLRSVEFKNGSNVEFHIPTLVRGDYEIKEVTQPKASANYWVFKEVPFKVSPQAVIRLEVQFPGGFDSQIDPGEFVLHGVAIDFLRAQ